MTLDVLLHEISVKEIWIDSLFQVYDDMDKFKVNDIVEFVGVLSVDPSLARFHNDGYVLLGV